MVYVEHDRSEARRVIEDRCQRVKGSIEGGEVKLNFRGILGTAAVLTLAASMLNAQVPQRQPQADATYPEAFSIVSGLREMPDGRLMITDGISQVVAWVDLEAGTMEQIGKEGQGPREYRTPDALFPWPGDSTLLVDLGNGRLTVLGPNGEFTRTMPIARQVGDLLVVVLPSAVDAEGLIYYQPLDMGGPDQGRGRPQVADSAAIARWDPRTDQVDTLGMVSLRERRTQTRGQNISIRLVPLTPEDAWSASPDGRVAVARSPEYFMEWLTAEGGKMSGSVVAFDPVRVGRDEKVAWMVNNQRGGLMIDVSLDAGGGMSPSFGRSTGRGGEPDITRYDWPATMPAFTSRAVTTAPNGDAWVRRSQQAGEASVYDVFGSDGELREQVVFSEGRQVIGFGAESVYTVYFDEFDLQWLERYRM
jgi:hypothetical protein